MLFVIVFKPHPPGDKLCYVLKSTSVDPPPPKEVSLIPWDTFGQLGAGAVFALAILFVVFKYGPGSGARAAKSKTDSDKMFTLSEHFVTKAEMKSLRELFESKMTNIENLMKVQNEWIRETIENQEERITRHKEESNELLKTLSDRQTALYQKFESFQKVNGKAASL